MPALREYGSDQLNGQREKAEKGEDGDQSDQAGGKQAYGFQTGVLFIDLLVLNTQRIASLVDDTSTLLATRIRRIFGTSSAICEFLHFSFFEHREAEIASVCLNCRN